MTSPSANQSQPALRKVGIVYQERYGEAASLAAALLHHVRAEGHEAWVSGAGLERAIDGQLTGTDAVLVLGGDGTILAAARVCAPLSVPLLGINFGRVGFLTELEPADVTEKLPLYLRGEYWVDERSMLYGEVTVGGTRRQQLALNDIVLARGAQPRVVRVNVQVDGHDYGKVVADGVIVCTATGSTAYNLAAGGPVLHPQVRSPVITPIAPHLVASRSLVLEPGADILLELVEGSGSAVLSADGQINLEISDGAQVRIAANRHTTRFLRRRPPAYFYHLLSSKLSEGA